MNGEQENITVVSDSNIEKASYRALKLDVDLYQSYLDDIGLTDNQRHAFLETMWNLIVGFVDLGFEVRAEESCGQDSDAVTARTIAAEMMVESTDCPAKQAFRAATVREREES